MAMQPSNLEAGREEAMAEHGGASGTLSSWLRERSDELSSAWSEEIRSRGLGQGTEVDRVVDAFVRHFVELLPWLLGPYGRSVDPVWVRAAQLFGTMSAKRGLAAGEVIEEFQVVRDLIIRALYREPPAELLSLRDVLRLNRVVDSGVTHASVGHTDVLFFEFFEADGAGGTRGSAAEVAAEAEAQLDTIREEFDALVESFAGVEVEGALGH